MRLSQAANHEAYARDRAAVAELRAQTSQMRDELHDLRAAAVQLIGRRGTGTGGHTALSGMKRGTAPHPARRKKNGVHKKKKEKKTQEKKITNHLQEHVSSLSLSLKHPHF